MYERYREWKRWEPGDFGKCASPDAVYFKSELTAAGIPDMRQVRVLEIGFGNAAFARWATDHGASYTGVERIPELVALGRECGLDVHVADARLDCLADKRGSLDVVVAFDVFEHLAIGELTSLLSALRDLLKEGGRLIARFPSGDSPFARAVQYGDLTHQTVLGSSAVRQLAASTGFAVDQAREPAFPVLGLGARAATRRALARLAQAVVFPLVARVFMGGGHPVLTPNMVAVFLKPPGCQEPPAGQEGGSRTKGAIERGDR